MPDRTSRGVTGAVLLAVAVSGCGGSGGGSGAPTDASKAAFCATFETPGKVSDPHRLRDNLARVGTPRDIGSAARHGFEVLVDRLGTLPAHANKGDLGEMSKNLSDTDKRDVVAFITYYDSACKALPSGFSS